MTLEQFLKRLKIDLANFENDVRDLPDFQEMQSHGLGYSDWFDQFLLSKDSYNEENQ